MLLNTALNPLFYWIFGMIGPAFATLLSTIVIQALQLYLTARHLDITFRCIFPWKECGKILLVNLAFAVFFWGMKAFSPLEHITGGTIEAVVLGIIWSACYLFLMRKRIFMLWNRLNNAGGTDPL